MVEEFWYAVPETCLLFAAFREDFSPFFVGKLTLLFFFKAFHWLADVRIDFVSTCGIGSATPKVFLMVCGGCHNPHRLLLCVCGRMLRSLDSVCFL